MTDYRRFYREDIRGEFYADEDSTTGLWCVFGSESGFCYATYASKSEAEQAAKNLNRGRVKHGHETTI